MKIFYFPSCNNVLSMKYHLTNITLMNLNGRAFYQTLSNVIRVDQNFKTLREKIKITPNFKCVIYNLDKRKQMWKNSSNKL